jgi:hypothetical protein
MKHPFLIIVLIEAGLSAPLHAHGHVPRGPDAGHATVRTTAHEDADREGLDREEMDRRRQRFEERRERLRALREEMLRTQPRPLPPPFRDDDMRRVSPERRDFMRPLLPPSREAEGVRRWSPEERQQFRRQLHEAGRDVYRGQ